MISYSKHKQNFIDPLRLNFHSGGELESSYNKIKWGIWIYFFLLIFEGALRKWVLPGLATPLLVIRDPIALWLIAVTWSKGLLPSNPYLSIMVIIGIVGIFTATLLGHGSLPVAIYGARIILIHFPLMFVIGKIFDRKDLLQMGKVTLMISIPMAILIALQFYSPQSSFVNRGIGGDAEGAGFDGAMGYFRPPGTFSFTNGTTLFFGLLGPFVLYFWLNPKEINRLILIGATVSLLVAIPLSISRSLLFYVLISVAFAGIGIIRKPEYLSKIFRIVFAGIIGIMILSTTSFFQTAIEVFFSRFDTANEVEGGLEGVLADRYLGGLLGALFDSSKQPFFGYGQGMGTNVGSMLLTGNNDVFLIAEGEWGRIIGELGPLMGLLVIYIRVALSFKIAIASYRKLAKGDLLPWMLFGFGIMILPQSQWAQPTSLGFSTLIGGLMIASFNLREDEYNINNNIDGDNFNRELSS